MDPINNQHRRRSAWRIIFMKYLPFCVHFALAAIVAGVFLRFLNGSTFNVTSRRPQYVEVDGSLSRITSYAPLQTDIATAVSVAATMTRVAGGWWAAGYIWRCIFMAMERRGISLEGLSQVISSWPPVPAPRHFTQRRHLIIIYITLATTFSIDYFSAILTGSVRWEPTYKLVRGSVNLSGVGKGINGAYLQSDGYLTYPDEQTGLVAASCASANLAWVELQGKSALNNLQPATNFRRVINGTAHLLPNSTLTSVRIPFFAVDHFEWIPHPEQILTKQQSDLIYDYHEYSPYFSGVGIGGLLPNSSEWGPSDTTPLDPHTVSETRLFSYRVERNYTSTNTPVSCTQNYLIDGTQINLHELQFPGDSGSHTDCFAIANVTYRAGAAVCDNCKLISPIVLGAQAPLTLVPDSFTSMALAMTPLVGTNLLFSNYSVPWNRYPTRKDFVIEFTSRAYQAAWAAFSDLYPDELDSTPVEIALPTLRARIIPWRVYLWVALHVWVIVLGLFFVYMQSRYGHPWVENTTMAIFWLDTSAVIGSDRHGVDLWHPGTEICQEGMLELYKADQASRSVGIVPRPKEA